MQPSILWFYGLSGAGKSTLTKALACELKERSIPCLVLDGDELRAGLNAGLGYTAEDRRENIRRAAEVAALACQQGMTVLAAFITPTTELRKLARGIAGSMPFAEVYLDCDYATAALRDVKGLYAKAAAGELSNFTGHDAPFDAPAAPDLRIDTTSQTQDQCLQQVRKFLGFTAAPLPGSSPSKAFNSPLLEQLAAFLSEIGLEMEKRALEDGTFLPGLALENGRIVVDETKLLYPGDILHEAGHLAVTPAAERHLCGGNLAVGGGEEMAAIAWSYAAALHIGMDPVVVFHPHGYRSGSDSLLENFRQGRYLAVPLLQWMGLALEPTQAAAQGVEPYPKMLRWVRA